MNEDIKNTGESSDPELATAAPSDEAPVEAAETSDPTAELQEKLSATHERLLRTAAELDNFRKRARRDVEEAQNRGRAEVLAEILPVIDSVDLALSSATEGAGDGIVEGLQMIKRQFLTAGERFGVKPVESRGAAFDPNIHEAVSQIYSPDHPAGQIVEEMRKGYLLGEKLLRAAMVVVSRGAPPAPSADEGSAVDTDNESSESMKE